MEDNAVREYRFSFNAKAGTQTAVVQTNCVHNVILWTFFLCRFCSPNPSMVVKFLTRETFLNNNLAAIGAEFEKQQVHIRTSCLESGLSPHCSKCSADELWHFFTFSAWEFHASVRNSTR